MNFELRAIGKLDRPFDELCAAAYQFRIVIEKNH